MPKEPELFPVTTAQQVLLMSLKYATKKSCANICAMVHFDSEMDINLLTQAVYLAILRSESCHLRLRKVGKEIMQYLCDEAPVQVPVLDYSDLTEEEMTKILDKWSQTPFPNGSMDTPLYVVKLYRRPGGMYSMYLCVSHLAFDAYSGVYFASEVHDLYGALRDGKAIAPAKSDYRKLCQQNYDYLASPKQQADIKFWESVLTPEPYGCPAEPSRFVRPKGARYVKTVKPFSDKGYQLDFTLDRELAKKVDQAAAEHRVSPQCYYLLAARSYLSKVNEDQDDVMFQNAVSRRASLLQKRSGGTLAGAVPFRMRMDNKNTTVSEALAEVSRLQQKYYAHADVNVFSLMKSLKQMYNTPLTCGYDPVLMTFSPYEARRPEGIHSHLASHSNGSSYTELYLNIMAQDETGDLNFNFEMKKAFVQPDTAEKMFNHMVKALTAMVEHPEMTLLEVNHQ